MTAPVLFDSLACSNDHRIGVATLNKPAALNALNLEMVELMLEQLQRWQHDDSVKMVIIDSSSDKAFCAGGDVVSMYHAMRDSAENAADPGKQAVPELLARFFSQEYRLDYLIHTYSKPILLWGHGIIMGGGLGLMAGASHRIVTATSRIAMPEVSIGLYPDVGGSWFLNRMPEGCGRFLGTTGASINAADCLYVNLADHFIDQQHKQAVIERLSSLDWQDSDAQNAQLLTEVCQQFSASEQPQSQVKKHQQVISELNQSPTVADYIEALSQLDSDDKWLLKAIDSVNYGSPITMHLVQQQLAKGAELTLAECFKMELIMSCRCGTFGEFQEGVRALLIDKDRNPDWAFAHPRDVEPAIIDSFFVSPWGDAHPLSDLELAPQSSES